jgi:hypothetical protein
VSWACARARARLCAPLRLCALTSHPPSPVTTIVATAEGQLAELYKPKSLELQSVDAYKVELDELRARLGARGVEGAPESLLSSINTLLDRAIKAAVVAAYGDVVHVLGRKNDAVALIGLHHDPKNFAKDIEEFQGKFNEALEALELKLESPVVEEEVETR